jgi:hypothetical protein
MKPPSLQRRGCGSVARGPRFRPLVEILECRIVPSVLDYSGGFASHGGLAFNGSALVTASSATPPSAAQLTHAQNQAGSVFTNSKVDITSFTTEFTLQGKGSGGGLTFTIENDSQAAAALGSNGTGLGASGISNSYSIKFGSSLLNGDTLQVTLTYNGTTLTESIKDLATGKTTTSSSPVNLAHVVGGSTAYVGFTGGTGGSTINLDILTWEGGFGTKVTGLAKETKGDQPTPIGSVPEGSGTFALLVTDDDGFVQGAQVLWNGTPLDTQFVDTNDLVATVPGSFVAEETSAAHGGLVSITVVESIGECTITFGPAPFAVTEAPITATGGFTISTVEGQAISNAPVATFIDTGGAENATLDYSATIDWGDGTTSTGTISGPDQNGAFTVSGSHTYAEDGENESDLVDVFTITTTIVHETVSDTATSTANVSEEAPPPLSVQGVATINGVEGQLLHNVEVATFSGPSASTGCTAVINWGDGTTSNGFITGPDQNGQFRVGGTHTFAEEGNAFHGGPFVITVTVTCGNESGSVSDSTNIVEAPISATGGFTLTAVQGQPVTGTVATFTDAGGPENPNNPGDYTATINWGDGSTSTGMITLSNQTFTGTSTHTYSGSGTFTITVNILHETVSATVTSTAIVTPTLSVQGVGNITGFVEGQSLTAVVATFTGTAVQADINWGDGTSSVGTISGPNSNGVFTVFGTHTYAEESNSVHGGNPFSITVTVHNSTSVSVTDTAFVAEAPIAATGGFTIQAVETETFTAKVATFIDTGGPENPSNPGDYTATIDWGDGTTSTGTITLQSNGVFCVFGTHTYAEDGEVESDLVDVFPITTTIVHETVSATATSTAFVSEEPGPRPGPSFTIQAVEGQAFTTTVATFTDNNEPASDFTATISWGDGTSSLGTVSGPDSNGVFFVAGSHTYSEESNSVHGGNPFIVTVTIHDEINVTVTDEAFVAEAPIAATGGFDISAVENQSFTTAVATFIDTGGPETTPTISDNYSATINWGDGTTSTGTITFSNGVFTVFGSHTYAEDGESESDLVDVFPIRTTIVHETVSATATSTAFVSEESPPVPSPGVPIHVLEGQAFTATVATFTDNNEPASDFTATINWGDGTTSLGTVSGPNSNGVFSVTGSHTYSEESNSVNGGNPFTVTVTIHDQVNVTVTMQAFVLEAPIVGTGGFTINGVEGQSFTATVATFVDTGGPETTPTISDNYSATINWGDGTTSTGTISGPDQNGVFTVTGTHAYAEETNSFHGTPTITVTITHETVSATVTDTPNIAEAPLAATGGLTISGVEGQSFTATVATFTDTGGAENETLDYTASIDWGDGTTSTGTISGPDQNGVFTVTGSHAYAEETNEFHGTPTITVTITHESVLAVVTDTPSIAEAPLSATAGPAVSAVVGQDVTAAVATFTDTGGPENATLDYAANIDWGDGTTTTGTISGPDQNGVFTVSGDHTYSVEGTFTINVTIMHESAPAVIVSTSASVATADMPLTATGMDISAIPFEGQDQMVAFFTDADPNAQAGNYLATIDWGDGTQLDTGNITQPGGPGTPFFVDFMHSYNNAGTFTVHVHIVDMGGLNDNGGAFADAFSTATVLGGGGAKLLPGQGLMATTGLHTLQTSPAQQATSVPVMKASAAVSSPSNTAGNDLYWALYSTQRDRLIDPSGWTADSLALALQGTSR